MPQPEYRLYRTGNPPDQGGPAVLHDKNQVSEASKQPVAVRAEPRWPATIGLAAFIGLYYALPDHLTLFPPWVLPLCCFTLVAGAQAAHRSRNKRWNELFAYASLILITVALLSSAALLIARLPAHRDSPLTLLKSALALWISNILVFASWYWRLDGGGPNMRDMRQFHSDGAFFFPQMAMDSELREAMGEGEWSPGFVDYLFLAFNTSTAFSPTDAPVLSRWAKLLMMIQSLISLMTVVLLAARAVNIL